METKFNLRNERQYAPHFYWVGLKYGDTYYSSTTDHSSMYINYILKCAKELHDTSPKFYALFCFNMGSPLNSNSLRTTKFVLIMDLF